MSTLAEKLRACAVLGGFGAVDVEDSDGIWREVLTLSSGDIVDIADVLEGRDASESRGQAAALRMEEPVAWKMGGCSSFTNSKLVAQRWSESGVSVVPLYAHPPAAEDLPTREDLETVLRTAFDSGRVRLGADTVLFGERSGLIEVNGRFLEREDKTPATFAQAVKVCADLVRAQIAEV